MSFVEHRWPVEMQTIDGDHGYRLYGALSLLCTDIHQGPWQIAPLVGHGCRDGRRLSGSGVLRLRGEARSSLLGSLNGCDIAVGSGGMLRIGEGSLSLVSPSPVLHARTVMVKTADALAAVVKIHGQLEDRIGRVPLVELGRKRQMVINKATVAGFEVTIHGLTSEESLAVQRLGIGGRRRMGAGVFLPAVGQ